MNPKLFMWMIYALWIALVLYLTVIAVVEKQEAKGRMAQSFGIMFLIIAAFLLPRLSIFSFVNFAPVSPELSSIGLVLCIAGMAFLVSARQHLGKNWSGTVSVKEGQTLIASGPYGYVRHPMYGGGLIATVGSAMVCGGAFVFLLLVLGPLFLWRVGAEDRLLAHEFPNEFPAYMQRTKKMIPLVW